jgi:Fur family transcriptional regulator, ferric uptake regulator
MEPTGYLDSLRPAGSKRSSKRDLIVNVFLRQEGHLTADDLFDLTRRDDIIRSARPPGAAPAGEAGPDTTRISRATVYRTLQWMVDAGIARKVDFGEGRFRFEHSYRHPRHFHLICKDCNRSFEFLSSDIESLLEEVAAARNFTARQSVLQIHGTCESCRTGRAPVAEGGMTELLFARDALRIAIATERSGLEFYSRAARTTRDVRGRRIFEKLADEEKEHLGTLEARYRELLQQDPQLESRPTFLFFKGAANGLFAAGAERIANGVDDRQALMIGIKCERGSHKFFKRYGEKFEDSEGRKIFLEFADEERAHLELLIREYRALLERQRRRPAARTGKRKTRRQAAAPS